MTPAEELMAARVRELVEGAAHEPWEFSAADARASPVAATVLPL